MKTFSLGIIASIVLFVPVAAWLYYEASLDRILMTANLVISSFGGVAIMFWLIILRKTKMRFVK